MATNTDTCSCAAVFNIVGLRLGTDRKLPIPIMAKFKFDSGVVPNIIFRKLLLVFLATSRTMEWSPQPLPSSDSSTIDQLHLQPPSLSAYNSVYEAERNCTAKLEAADVLPPTVRRPETERIYLRVVGWLFVFAPRPECHSTLSRWITACENDTTAIVHLGRSLCNSYLRLCKHRTVEFTEAHTYQHSLEKY